MILQPCTSISVQYQGTSTSVQCHRAMYQFYWLFLFRHGSGMSCPEEASNEESRLQRRVQKKCPRKCPEEASNQVSRRSVQRSVQEKRPEEAARRSVQK